MEKPANVIYNGLYGSHLYGLDTPVSDLDYKGVYAPSMTDLVFNTYKDSMEHQTDEVDETYYAVTKFLRILEKNDTVSTDMLFSNKEAAIEASPLWWELRSYREDLLCKNMRGLFGYIKTQSSKYGHKVQRYEEIKEFLSLIEWAYNGSQLISDTDIVSFIANKNFKYISFTPKHKDICANIDVCGSKYQTNAQVQYMVKGLQTKLNRYGDRTKKGSLQHGDWKSLSHSLRVLIQMQELIETRDLIFPLVRKEEILAVKMGQVEQSKVMGLIDENYDIVTEMMNKSDLPEHNDMTRMKEAVLDYYGVK